MALLFFVVQCFEFSRFCVDSRARRSGCHLYVCWRYFTIFSFRSFRKSPFCRSSAAHLSPEQILIPPLYWAAKETSPVEFLLPKDNHTNQDKRGKNHIADKVHPMDALTATKPLVFVLDIKTQPTIFHLNNHLRQKLYTDFHR